MPFPTAGVLEDANRADAPLNAGSWGELDYASVPLAVISNQVGAGGNFAGSYWTAPFAASQEVFCTLPVLGSAGAILWLRVANPLITATMTAYTVYWDGGGNLKLYRMDAGNSFHQLATAAVALGAGDKLGGQIVGSTFTAWRKTPAGAWTQILSATDGTYTNAGCIAWYVESSSTKLDDLGGGVSVATLPFAPADGFPRLADGTLAMTTTAAGSAFAGGHIRAPSGELVVTTGASVKWSGGFRRDAADLLAVAVDAAGAWSGGFVRDASGALCVTSTGPFSWSPAGFLRDSAGRLAVQFV